MSSTLDSSPLRVERILRLLPDVDALTPLRAFLIATSRGHASVEPHLTVGKRVVRSRDLHDMVPRAIQQVGEHLTALYGAAINALEAEEQDNPSAAVRAFLHAGDIELRVSRDAAARKWYEHALQIAEQARDRRPEIETLQRLGQLEGMLGDPEKAARYFQRSLALADAESDAPHAASASLGLGDMSLAIDNVRGAASWYSRGIEFAGTDPVLRGRLCLGMGAVALAKEDLAEADEWVNQAREHFAELGHAEGTVDVLKAQSRLAARRGHHVEALAGYREALSTLQGRGRDPRIEMAVRLDICQLFLEADRLPDAEDEIRRAEELAIVHNFTRQLARVYVIMGSLRATQRDETGFVFFEKAIELARGGEPAPRLEAEAYAEYAAYRESFGEIEEARAYLERAREIVDALGDTSFLARVDAALAKLPTI